MQTGKSQSKEQGTPEEEEKVRNLTTEFQNLQMKYFQICTENLQYMYMYMYVDGIEQQYISCQVLHTVLLITGHIKLKGEACL